MEKNMTESISLGQAIDQIHSALSSLDPNARPVALQAVCSLMNIQLDPETKTNDIHSGATEKAAETTTKTHSEVNTKTPKVIKDIRSLKDEKKPASAIQMACLVAYYLSELAVGDEKSETVSTTDLDKYFKQANFKLPSDIKQVLKNAKKAGYFESAERGKYRLNAVGYNLVTHGLPASGSV